MGIFLKLMELSFKKRVNQILVGNVPNFKNIERSLPRSTVDQAYNSAWILFGKENHFKPSAVYTQKCVEAAEYVIEHHETAAKMFFGICEKES